MEFIISCNTPWLCNKHFQMQLEIFPPVMIFIILCSQYYFHLLFSTPYNALCSCSLYICKIAVEMTLEHISITSAPIIKAEMNPTLVFYRDMERSSLHVHIPGFYTGYYVITNAYIFFNEITVVLEGCGETKHIHVTAGYMSLAVHTFCMNYSIQICRSLFPYISVNEIPLIS